MKGLSLLLLVLVIATSGIAACRSNNGGTASHSIGTIKTPTGDNIKVIFTGLPGIEDKWEKVGLLVTPPIYQAHLVGSITNKSGQDIFIEEITFLFDGNQVGRMFFGRNMKAEESIRWGDIPPEGAKILEVRVVGAAAGATAVPATPTPPKATLSPEQVVKKWYDLLKQGKFIQALEFYGPEKRKEIESKGGATYLKNEWDKNPITEFVVINTQIEPNQKEAQVYIKIRFADGTYYSGEDPTNLYKIGGEWKIGY